MAKRGPSTPAFGKRPKKFEDIVKGSSEGGKIKFLVRLSPTFRLLKTADATSKITIGHAAIKYLKAITRKRRIENRVFKIVIYARGKKL